MQAQVPRHRRPLQRAHDQGLQALRQGRRVHQDRLRGHAAALRLLRVSRQRDQLRVQGPRGHCGRQGQGVRRALLQGEELPYQQVSAAERSEAVRLCGVE